MCSFGFRRCFRRKKKLILTSYTTIILTRTITLWKSIMLTKTIKVRISNILLSTVPNKGYRWTMYSPAPQMNLKMFTLLIIRTIIKGRLTSANVYTSVLVIHRLNPKNQVTAVQFLENRTLHLSPRFSYDTMFGV